MEHPHEPEKDLSTPDLIRLALSQTRTLARAEILYAKTELLEELKEARVGGGFLGAAYTFGAAGIAALFLAGGLALPLLRWAAALVTAGVLFALAVICVAIGVSRLPKKPLHKTQERLKEDYEHVRAAGTNVFE